MTHKDGKMLGLKSDQCFSGDHTCVTDDRAHLFNGRDIIGEFVRELVKVMTAKTQGIDLPLRLLKVELERQHSLHSSSNPIVISSFAHLYFAIEHALLDTGSVNGVTKRHETFGNRRDLDTNNTLMRLDAFNELGERVCWSLRRDTYSADAATTLSDQFLQEYGEYFIRFFRQFSPLEFHGTACSKLESNLNEGEVGLLINWLFSCDANHKESVDCKTHAKRERHKDVTHHDAAAKRLVKSANLCERRIEEFQTERAQLFCSQFTSGNSLLAAGNLLAPVVKFIDDLYRDVFSTVAFQTAVCCSFFREIENAAGLPVKTFVDKQQAFDEYIEQLNAFFAPATMSQFDRLLNTFGDDESVASAKNLSRLENRGSFRSVVFQGDMQPDQWPSYRAVLLEIWRPSIPVLKDRVKTERDLCRRQVFESLYRDCKRKYCRLNIVKESELAEKQNEYVFQSAKTIYAAFLENLSANELPSTETLRQISSHVPGEMPPIKICD